MRFILSVLLLAVPLSYLAIACGDKEKPVVVTPRLHVETPRDCAPQTPCRPCGPLDVCPKWPETCPKACPPKVCPKTPLYGPRVVNPDRVCVFPVYNYRYHTPGRPLLNILRGVGRVAAAPFVIGAKISHNRRTAYANCYRETCRCGSCRCGTCR